MTGLPKITDKRFYMEGSDDAAVFKVSEELAMVQTVDFITPVLNDPYSFGAVAAANALSDIYAMGAEPVFALNIVCFPVKSLPVSILEEVLRGGSDAAAKAGVTIAGGHSVEDNAPKYGMAVTGTANPAKLLYKKGACPGDKLFLTKPLGSGIITTAIDRDLAGDRLIEKVYNLMVELNRGAAKAMMDTGVNACTDVSGYGFLGHLYEMMAAGGTAAKVYTSSVPVIEEVWDLVRSGVVPGGTHNNCRYLVDKVNSDRVSPETRTVLCDSQTSGGLLIAVSPEKSDKLAERLNKEGCLAAACVGEITNGTAGTIELLP